MPWQKAPPELVARFDKAFPRLPGAERRLMFGFPAGFMNGNMFGGVFEDRVMVRLAGDDLKGLKGAVPFEPMPGRTMTGYSELPASATKSAAALGVWLARAASATAALPPKTKAAKKAKAVGKTARRSA